ncbi:hypothetical protein BGX24_005424 [Mortierella sp. AD032]|nr:hypothetical protein BGX24_005424 [Mortierella sp. AD032]
MSLGQALTPQLNHLIRLQAMGMHQDPKSHDCDQDAFLPGYVTFAVPVREPFYRKLPPESKAEADQLRLQQRFYRQLGALP